MELGIYKSAAGALAAEARLDVIANNIANIDTPGFKHGYAVIQARETAALELPRFEPSRREVLDRLGGGALVSEVAFDRSSGALFRTGRDLDVAIEGDGWFPVAKDGETFYTRAGNFLRAADGRLVAAASGAAVLSDAGQPIVLPSGARTAISEDGAIFVDDEPIAHIAARGTLDPGQFAPHGDNLFRYLGQGAPAPASNSRFHQAFLERGTTNAVREMVAMIRAFRAYESNQRVIVQQDETFGRAVNDVGRLGG